MAKYVIEDTTLTGIADAIRAKTGSTDPISVTDMAARIAAITGGGSNETLTTILEEQTLENTVVEASTPLIVGETYIVVWDGTEYECEAFNYSPAEDSTFTIIGNPAVADGEDDGTPFAVLYASAEVTGTTAMYNIVTTDTATTHTIAIYQKTSGGGSVEGIVYVTFMNGGTELCKTACMKGDSTVDPVADGKIAVPTKDPTNTVVYTHSGWALTEGDQADALALMDVTEDRTVYAAYTESTRLYTINFWDGDALLESVQTAYGAMPVYTVPEKEHFEFVQWSPALTAVTGDADYYAQWEDSTVISDDWDAIIASVNDGTYSSKYAIGQCKALNLGELGTVNMEIVAFDRTPLSDGSGTAHITWIAKELLNTPQVVNSKTYAEKTTGTGAYGGWYSCELKTYCDSTVLEAVPTNVKSALQSVYTPYGQYVYDSLFTNAWTWNTSVASGKVWVPSHYELIRDDGAYTESESRCVRYSEAYPAPPYVKATPDGTVRKWWLRTGYGKSTDKFSCMNTSGGYSFADATSEAYVCIGFCI